MNELDQDSGQDFKMEKMPITKKEVIEDLYTAIESFKHLAECVVESISHVERSSNELIKFYKNENN